MTYALAWPLQQAVHARLVGDAAVAALVGDRVWDGAPPVEGEATELHLTLGDESAEDWSTATSRGARHTLTVTVSAPREGFAEAKQAAGAVCDALAAADLPLSRGRLVCLAFAGAGTLRREAGALRRIRLTFTALVEDD